MRMRYHKYNKYHTDVQIAIFSFSGPWLSPGLTSLQPCTTKAPRQSNLTHHNRGYISRRTQRFEEQETSHCGQLSLFERMMKMHVCVAVVHAAEHKERYQSQ